MLMTKRIVFFSLTVGLFVLSVVDASAQSRSGTFNRKDKWGSGRLIISDKGRRNAFSFKLNVGRTSKNIWEMCVGEMSGKAKWISENIAEFNADFNERNSDGEAVACRLTFVFSGNTINIRETDCNDYHGAMCNFEGKYSRPTPKLPKRKPKRVPTTIFTV